MMPLTLAWAPPPVKGTTLVVMFAYHGRDRDSAPPNWLDRLESPASRGHRIVHRDHYANPRSFEYMRDAVLSTLVHLTRTPADLVIDRGFDVPVEAMTEGAFGRVAVADAVDPRAWRADPLVRAREYDNVLLAYPDALGLGCGAAEARALDGRTSILVLNGRRRAFRLTHAMQRRLILSRMLAHTRIAERGLALAVRPVAAVLARWDRVIARI
jgi:hypothetical protein